VVTRHGKPFVRITPAEEPQPVSLEGSIRQLLSDEEFYRAVFGGVGLRPVVGGGCGAGRYRAVMRTGNSLSPLVKFDTSRRSGPVCSIDFSRGNSCS